MTPRDSSRYRPAVHLSPPQGWCNDPVGFIHWQGAWHLFYQHQPDSPHWGPMHWGHALSRDLIRWQHLPHALVPDSLWDQGGCFSGSAIGHGPDALELMYTGVDRHGSQTQCLARSSDGIRFRKDPANPVITASRLPPGISRKDFRDPRLLRHEGGLYAVIGSRTEDHRGQVLMFRQERNGRWGYQGVLLEGTPDTGTMWECPDLFSLGGMDVLLVSPQFLKPQGEAYRNLHGVMAFIGRMDWEACRFQPVSSQPLDWGFDFYAPQTALSPDGRRLLVAWMDMWEQPHPTADLGHGWAGQMTLPRELTLRDGRLTCQPLRELKSYRAQHRSWSGFPMGPASEPIPLEPCFDLEVTLRTEAGKMAGLRLVTGPDEETRLHCLPREGLLVLDITRAGLSRTGVRQARLDRCGETLQLRLIRDRSSLEVFADDGGIVMSARIFPRGDAGELHLWGDGAAGIQRLDIWTLGK